MSIEMKLPLPLPEDYSSYSFTDPNHPSVLDKLQTVDWDRYWDSYAPRREAYRQRLLAIYRSTREKV